MAKKQSKRESDYLIIAEVIENGREKNKQE
jgi:hypothetical protein